MLKTFSQVYHHYYTEINTAGKSLTALVIAIIPYDFIRELFNHPPSEVFVKWCQLLLVLITIINVIYNFNKKK